MDVGVIGSGSIGPDLAYGFASAIGSGGSGRIHLLDIRQEALDAGMERIRGYARKAVSRGKLSARAAQAVESALAPTTRIEDLAGCDYVLEAATEDLDVKRKILSSLEKVVREDALIGFATSGIPRISIAAKAARPERCFVNHPFFPAWRSLPVEVVLSGDAAIGRRMLGTLRALGKVPVVVADVACFAADDIFCTYCAEAARIVVEGLATPSQVDAVVNAAIGGGGPFQVMDLTRGNLLNAHCLELMRDAPTGSRWFDPPAIFRVKGNQPWLDRDRPADPPLPPARAKEILDRILAVLLGRAYVVVERGTCAARELNWLTRTALGFRSGLLDLGEEMGADAVRAICTAYASDHPGYQVPDCVASRRLPSFLRTVDVSLDGGIAVVAVHRPEVRNALDERTMAELERVFAQLEADAAVKGVVLTSFDGALAGADINELAALPTPAAAQEKCRRGHRVLDRIAGMSKPVVAAVDGPVLGGGAELSMACHARVVGPRLLLGQPEVNLGIIPGYGGTQRLARLIGSARALEMLRTGRTIGAAEACAWGWATGEPAPDVTGSAKALVLAHLRGEVRLAPVDPAPLPSAEIPAVDIGHRSLAIDSVLVDVVRRGTALPLSQGLEVEAAGFALCRETVDSDIGLKNFVQNGPRVPAVFLHE